MKYFLGTLLIALLFIGCGDKKEDAASNNNQSTYDTSDVVTTPIENPNQKFLLRYKFDKDQIFKYRITSISSDSIKIFADSTINQNIQQTITYILNVKLANMDKDSVEELNCTFKSVKLVADANGKKFNYDSGVTNDSTTKSHYPEYAALVDNPFSVRINKLGEILEVFRADRITDSFLKLKGYSDSVSTEQKNNLRDNIVNGALKPMLILVFRKMPENLVAKDSAWTDTQPSGKLMIFEIQNTNTFKVDKLEKMNNDKVASIKAGLRTKITGKNKVTDRGATYEFQKPITEASGNIFFNVTKGLIQKSKTQTRIDVSYKMEAPGPKGKQKGSKSEIIINTNIVELL